MPNPAGAFGWRPKFSRSSAQHSSAVHAVGESKRELWKADDIREAESKRKFAPNINKEVPDFERLHAKMDKWMREKKEEYRALVDATAPKGFNFASSKRASKARRQSPHHSTSSAAADKSQMMKTALLGGQPASVSRRWEAYIEVQWPDGALYKGEQDGDIPHGYGEWQHPAGNTYRGHWSCGVFHGQGVYKWNNGDEYEGNYVNGVAEGSGILRLPGHGGKYTGQFERGLPNGTGEWDYDNGDHYVGQFRDGSACGRGEFNAGDGSWFYTGEYDNDKPHGNGCMEWRSGEKYSGSFHRGEQQGKGEFETARGDKITCEFASSLAQGNAVVDFANGDRYEGSFQGGFADGFATYTFSDGSRWTGSFKQGRPWGLGKLVNRGHESRCVWASTGSRKLHSILPNAGASQDMHGPLLCTLQKGFTTESDRPAEGSGLTSVPSKHKSTISQSLAMSKRGAGGSQMRPFSGTSRSTTMAGREARANGMRLAGRKTTWV